MGVLFAVIKYLTVMINYFARLFLKLSRIYKNVIGFQIILFTPLCLLEVFTGTFSRLSQSDYIIQLSRSGIFSNLTVSISLASGLGLTAASGVPVVLYLGHQKV